MNWMSDGVVELLVVIHRGILVPVRERERDQQTPRCETVKVNACPAKEVGVHP
jgi:hypothetical protein